ncbi:hypothetical protein MTO96_029168 [Rhipicephalus appendiculatus]
MPFPTSYGSTNICTGVAQRESPSGHHGWGLRASVCPAVQPPLRYTRVGGAVVPACRGPSLPASRVASTYHGSLPGHDRMQQLCHLDCLASPRRPAADANVGPVL